MKLIPIISKSALDGAEKEQALKNCKAKKRFSLFPFLAILCVFLAWLSPVSTSTPPHPSVSASHSNAGKALPVDQAFAPTATLTRPGHARITWKIANEYHLYKDRTRVEVVPPGVLEKIRWPKGEKTDDPFLGTTMVYKHQVSVPVVFSTTNHASSIELRVSYQGCHDEVPRICYPPQTRLFKLALKSDSPRTDTPFSKNTRASVVSGWDSSSEPKTWTSQGDSVAGIGNQALIGKNENKVSGNAVEEKPPVDGRPHISGDGIAVSENAASGKAKTGFSINTLIGFYLAGLLMSFTPCMWPMWPILAAAVRRKEARGATINVAFYVLGSLLVFVAAGWVIGRLGLTLSAWTQSPMFILCAAAVLFFAGAAALGFFSMSLRVGSENKWGAMVQNWSGPKRWLGLFVMGVLAALVAGPCVTPALAGALVLLAQQANPWYGVVSLGVLGLGLNTPLFIFGTSCQRWMPRSGSWMVAAERVIGHALWLTALLVLDRLDLGSVLLWLAALWAFHVGIDIWSATEKSPKNQDGDDEEGHSVSQSPRKAAVCKLGQSVALMFLLAGVLEGVGAAAGHTDMWRPLGHDVSTRIASVSSAKGGAASQETFDDHGKESSSTPTISLGLLNAIPVGSRQDLVQQLVIAEKEDTPVWLIVHADWCVSCKAMERDAFSRPSVADAARSFRVLSLDLSRSSKEKSSLAKHLGLFGPPVSVFWENPKHPKRFIKVVGEVSLGKLLSKLQHME